MKARLNGYEFRQAIEQATHKICSELKLKPVTVAYSNGASTAGINSKGDIMLPNVADDAIITRPLFDRYVGFILHELLHRKYTDFNINGHNRYLDELHNALEDAMIEHLCITEGLVGNAHGLLSQLVDGMVDQALAEVSDWSDPRQYPFVLAVYARQHATRKIPLANGLKPIFDKASADVLNAKTSEDTFAIAKWVLSQLRTLSKPQPPRPQPSQDGQNRPTSPDQGTGEGEGTGQGDSPSDSPSDSPADGEGQGQGTDAGDAGVGDAVSPLTSDKTIIIPREVEPSISAPDDCATGGTYSKAEQLCKKHTWDHQRYNIKIENTVGGKLRYDVRKMFENTDTSEHQPKRKAGALDSHALHTISVGNNRVFKRRLDSEGIDSAVVVVLDVSGSMFPREIEPAVNACVALVDALEKAQVKTAMLTFGDETAVLKPFNKPLQKVINQLPNLGSGGGTNDYFAVRYAHEMLHGMNVGRKVCFVITDGQGDMDNTAKQVETGERMGITTIGIGIQINVDQVYKNSVTVRHARDLGTVAFNKIKLVA